MFGKNSTRHRCRWVCDRLPLLDGGELTGSDRRKVESHLVVCPSCRARRIGLSEALNALRSAGSELPVSAAGTDAPSLWPALQRQIRETRHLPRPSPFAEFLSRYDRPSYRFAAMAATSLIAATTWAVANAWSLSQISKANAFTASASQPFIVVPATPHSALDFGPSVAKTDVESSSKTPERIPSRIGYDLERGTVTNNGDTGQIKPSY